MQYAGYFGASVGFYGFHFFFIVSVYFFRVLVSLVLRFGLVGVFISVSSTVDEAGVVMLDEVVLLVAAGGAL